MRTVFKYPLLVTDHQIVSLPWGATILCVQNQNETPVLYADVPNTENKPKPRIFRTYGTGHPMEETHLVYIGTYQLRGGSLVFHVYEEPT